MKQWGVICKFCSSDSCSTCHKQQDYGPSEFKPKSELEKTVPGGFVPDQQYDVRAKLKELVTELGKRYGLSPRQQEIVFYQALGYDITETAGCMEVTYGAVKSSLHHHIYPKLCITHKGQLLAVLIEMSIKKGA